MLGLAFQLFEYGHVGMQRFELMLGEERNLYVVSFAALARIEVEGPRDNAKQSRLARAVRPRQGNTIPAANLELDSFVNGVVPVALVDVDQVHRHFAGARRVGDLHPHAALCVGPHFDSLDFG